EIAHGQGARSGVQQVPGVVVVLQNGRDTVERTDRTALLERRVERIGNRERVRIGFNNRVDSGTRMVEGRNFVEIRLNQVVAGQRMVLERRFDLRDRGFFDLKGLTAVASSTAAAAPNRKASQD